MTKPIILNMDWEEFMEFCNPRRSPFCVHQNVNPASCMESCCAYVVREAENVQMPETEADHPPFLYIV